MPTIRQLQYLIALAEEQSFKRAAERTHSSQPTISEQLKSLETQIGVQLIVRSSGKVTLTSAGEEVAAIAREILRLSKDIEIVTRKYQRLTGSEMKMGISQSLGPPFMSRILPVLDARVTMLVSERTPDELRNGISNGTFDIVVTPAKERGPEGCDFTTFSEPVYLAFSRKHAFACNECLQPNDLHGVDMLYLVPSFQMHDLSVEFAKSFGCRLRNEYEITSFDSLREMVRADMGVAFFPALYAMTSLRDDELSMTSGIEDVTFSRTIRIAWRRQDPRASRLEHLADEIASAMKACLAIEEANRIQA